MRTIPLGILGISSSLGKWNYLKNWKLFLNFLFHLWNLHQILNSLGKKTIVIADVFRKLQTVKYLLKPHFRKLCFRTSFDSQRINGCQQFVKSRWEQFYQIFWSLWREMTWKISPLWIFEILGVFVNTLTTDDDYPVRDCENLLFPIQMEIS